MSKAFLYGVGAKPALLGSKTITENGIYDASADNLDGYASVDVNVSGGGGGGEPLDPIEVYNNTRPADWLPINLPSEMETLYPNQDRIEILFDIAPDVNVITFEITSTVVGVTVDWGDGTTSTSDTTTYAFSKQYGALVVPQVLIVVSTTKDNIKGINFNKTYTYQNADGTSYSLNKEASSNIVEVSINASSCSNLILCAFALAISFYKLRYFSAETIFNNALRMFNYCYSLTTIPMLNTSKVTNMSYMFNYCYSLTTIPMLDTANVTDMSSMFNNCYSLVTIPMLDTNKVTNMSYMFYFCYSLITIPMLDTNKVTNMDSMLGNCYSLTTIPMLNTSKVTNMLHMFNYCYSLTTIPMLDTANVINMGNMFNYCYSLITIPMLDTNKVTNMSYMFNYCYSLTTMPMLNTSKVTNMLYMFNNCFSLTTIPMLNTSKVTNMRYMFNYCYSLTTIPMLDTNKVTNMDSMLGNCYNITHSHLVGAKKAHSYTDSLLLTTSTLVEILNNLGTVTVATTLTLGVANLAKLSPEQKQIALNKGWTLA